MKKLLFALVVLTTAGQIMPLFNNDGRPGILERAVTAPARIVDPEYRGEFNERKHPERYSSDKQYKNGTRKRSRDNEESSAQKRRRISRTAD